VYVSRDSFGRACFFFFLSEISIFARSTDVRGTVNVPVGHDVIVPTDLRNSGAEKGFINEINIQR